MAASKTRRSLLASGSLAAGASTSTSELNLSTAYGALVVVKITNGASAPTTAPLVIFYTGGATGEKSEIWRATGDTVNNSVKYRIFEYSLPHMFANVTITNGATNAITVEVYAEEASGV